MKYVIKFIPLLLFTFLPTQVFADSFENILRKTAIDRGVLPSQNLYDNRDQSLVKLGEIFFNSEKGTAVCIVLTYGDTNMGSTLTSENIFFAVFWE